MAKFAENETFSNLYQPSLDDVWEKDYPLKGKWHAEVFKNQNPIVLELGCGKGEYTVNLAKQNPHKNFIGVDIKGARLWRGAKEAFEKQMPNVAFVRSRIEHIPSIFQAQEISEIWVTFPDPQPSKSKKRLTSPKFLTYYQKIVRPGCIVHLKTDSQELHEYTKEVVLQNKLNLLEVTNDLYRSGLDDEVLSIKTFYEQMFLEQGKPITYIKFELDREIALKEPVLE